MSKKRDKPEEETECGTQEETRVDTRKSLASGRNYRWEAKIEWLFASVYGSDEKGCDAEIEGVYELPSGRRMLVRAKPYHAGGRFPEKGDTFEEIQSWAMEITRVLNEALADWKPAQVPYPRADRQTPGLP